MKLFDYEWFHPKDAPAGVEFEVRGMTMGELLQSKAVMAEHGPVSVESYRHAFDCGLRNWRGIEGEACTADNALHLPQRLADPVMQRILVLSGLIEDEEKNSPSPLMSPASDGDSTATPAAGADTAT